MVQIGSLNVKNLHAALKDGYARPGDRFEVPVDGFVIDIVRGDLRQPFTTVELAEAAGKPKWVAQKMAYCLRNMGAASIIGKNGNALLYELQTAAG